MGAMNFKLMLILWMILWYTSFKLMIVGKKSKMTSSAKSISLQVLRSSRAKTQITDILEGVVVAPKYWLDRPNLTCP